MAFTPKTAPFSGKINAVTLGTGDKAIVIGGQNVLPFYTFDAPIENAPKIGVEISDLASEWTAPALKEFYAGCTTMADYAKKAETMEGADFLCLHFESADPNGANRSVADGIAKDNDERMKHCHNMLERGLSLGMEATDLWFDPLFLVVKGMQDKQMDVLNAIKLFADEGLKSTGGLSNNSNGAPKTLRPIMDSALVAMAMMQGLTSAIVSPCDLRLMETIKSCDIFKNHVLYSDSYLEL